MKQTIMSRLQEIYQSVPAHITDDDEIMLRIAHTIICESSPYRDLFRRLASVGDCGTTFSGQGRDLLP